MIQLSVKSGFYLTLCAAFALAWYPFRDLYPCFIYSLLVGACAPLFFYQEKHIQRHSILGILTFLAMFVFACWATLWIDYVILKKPANIAFEEGVLFEIFAPLIIAVIFGIPVCIGPALVADLLVSLLISRIRRLIGYEDGNLFESTKQTP